MFLFVAESPREANRRDCQRDFFGCRPLETDCLKGVSFRPVWRFNVPYFGLSLHEDADNDVAGAVEEDVFRRFCCLASVT